MTDLQAALAYFAIGACTGAVTLSFRRWLLPREPAWGWIALWVAIWPIMTVGVPWSLWQEHWRRDDQ